MNVNSVAIGKDIAQWEPLLLTLRGFTVVVVRVSKLGTRVAVHNTTAYRSAILDGSAGYGFMLDYFCLVGFGTFQCVCRKRPNTECHIIDVPARRGTK